MRSISVRTTTSSINSASVDNICHPIVIEYKALGGTTRAIAEEGGQSKEEQEQEEEKDDEGSEHGGVNGVGNGVTTTMTSSAVDKNGKSVTAL